MKRKLFDSVDKKYYCYTCGAEAITKSVVYAFEEETGKPLIHTWRECSKRQKWITRVLTTSYHPVTAHEGLPYYAR